MGSFLSNALGTTNKYQASSPYQYDVLTNELQNQAQIYGGQNQLAQQLQAQAAGQGPNPAQLQYQQNVQGNIANAQGMIASQRGLNPALAAKMGSNQASQMNQQAAGQSGVMQAQQQLGAQQNLGNLYGQMQSGNLGQQQLFNQANMGAQQINSGVASGNQQTANALVGGIMGAAGSGAQAMAGGGGKAHGGMIGGYADGGIVDQGNMPQSILGQNLMQPMSMPQNQGAAITAGMAKFKPGAYNGGIMNAVGGGNVPGTPKVNRDDPKNDTQMAMVTPKEIVLPLHVTEAEDAPERAKKFVAAILAKNGMRKK